jgi:hypothetical protein
VIGLVLLVVGRKGSASVASALLTVLGAQSCANALLDIRVLFAVGSSTVPGQGRSDAAAMEELLLLPYWLWASLWLTVSVAVLALTLWQVWRRQDRPATLRARARRTAS